MHKLYLLHYFFFHEIIYCCVRFVSHHYNSLEPSSTSSECGQKISTTRRQQKWDFLARLTSLFRSALNHEIRPVYKQKKKHAFCTVLIFLDPYPDMDTRQKQWDRKLPVPLRWHIFFNTASNSTTIT